MKHLQEIIGENGNEIEFGSACFGVHVQTTRSWFQQGPEVGISVAKSAIFLQKWTTFTLLP